MLWLRRIEPILRPLIHLMFRLRRGLTLGVRGVVTDAEGRVLMVQHTYLKGWHLPGGGVERRETAQQALARELQEEAGVRVTGPAVLASIHSNEIHHKGDHVLVYRVQAWEACEASQQGEIHEVAWFAPDALPEAVTPGTRKRIAELFDGAPPDPMW